MCSFGESGDNQVSLMDVINISFFAYYLMLCSFMWSNFMLSISVFSVCCGLSFHVVSLFVVLVYSCDTISVYVPLGVTDHILTDDRNGSLAMVVFTAVKAAMPVVSNVRYVICGLYSVWLLHIVWVRSCFACGCPSQPAASLPLCLHRILCSPHFAPTQVLILSSAALWRSMGCLSKGVRCDAPAMECQLLGRRGPTCGCGEKACLG